jgi:hypothetical protein
MNQETNAQKMFFLFQSYRKTPERIKIASEEFCGLQYIEQSAVKFLRNLIIGKLSKNKIGQSHNVTARYRSNIQFSKWERKVQTLKVIYSLRNLFYLKR